MNERTKKILNHLFPEMQSLVSYHSTNHRDQMIGLNSTSSSSSSSPNHNLLSSSLKQHTTTHEEEYILTQFNPKNHCLCITLNRPKSFNALSLSMILSLRKVLENALKNPNVHFVILQSASEKAFCAGGDIKDLRRGFDYAQQFFTEEFSLNYFIYEFCKEKPIISMLNGITFGGGVGISISTNFRVANRKRYQFAMPEVFIGIYPDIGASWFLTHSCPSMGIARYIGMTGDKIGATDALFSKLVTHVIDNEDDFYELRNDLLTKFVESGNGQSIERQLADFIQIYEKKGNSVLNSTLGHVDRHRRVIDYCFGEEANSVREVINNLKWYKEYHPSRCQSDTEFIDSVLELFSKRASPTSLIVTFEALNRGKKAASLKEVLDLDKVLCTNLVGKHDFIEGVRAVLIDKDYKPKFKPSTLDELNIEKVINEIFNK